MDKGFNREPGGTLNSMTTGGRSYYYLTDAIGSVIGLVDVDGNKVDTYAYSPRGVRLLAQSTEPVAQPYRFAGNYQDPTGLYHLKARYYDANIGRFTQPDPSGQEKNPYLYAEGDPVNRIDPNGLLSFSEVNDWYGRVNNFNDGLEAINAARNGDWGTAKQKVVGIIGSEAATLTCETVVVLAAGPTAGASTAGAVGCALTGEAFGEWAENHV
ncbi:RHS repeat-associated core domain-containing protein [Streptomyces galbus]|uniref:RHS repeat-associated core domain-containing protein n=1 Tax=Streptomyces galbus TaxID=33898 RepID=UPI0035E3EFF5